MQGLCVNWRKLAVGIAGALAVSGFVSTPVLAKTELLVYTAAEADELAGFKKAFETEYPDIDIQWVRASTGIVMAKLRSEEGRVGKERVSQCRSRWSPEQ